MAGREDSDAERGAQPARQERRGRRHRRARRPGVSGADPRPGLRAAEHASFDTDRSWGDRSDSNDRRLWENVPPHWGRR